MFHNCRLSFLNRHSTLQVPHSKKYNHHRVLNIKFDIEMKGPSAWALVQPLVANAIRVCSYDRRGYGWYTNDDSLFIISKL